MTAAHLQRLVAGAAVALLVVGCGGGSHTKVVVGTAARGTVVETVEAPGAVAARAQATISSPAAGTVATLMVHDGQRVTAGTTIMRVDSPTAEQRLRQAQQADRQAAAATISPPSVDLTSASARLDAAAQAAFTSARAAAEALPAGPQRTQALTTLATAVAAYSTAQAQARAAIAQAQAGLGSLSAAVSALSAAQRTQTAASLSVARATVDALVVRAPINGIVELGTGTSSSTSAAAALPDSITSLLGGTDTSGASGTAVVEEGSLVDNGGLLATVFDLSRLTVTAEVDETDVLLVHPGVTASVELDAAPDASYAAIVTAVDLAPTSSARGGVSYQARLTLRPGRLADGGAAPTPLPGMSAVVSLRVRTSVDAVAVPAAAIVRDGSHDAVWVDDGGRASLRRVVLGAEGEDSVAVLDGLAVGDRLVVSGADAVHAGQKLPR